ncbi:hypothetical protein M419DRAFT_136703 [Trichoderma reesei RUT C-30]|uniref:Xylanolytic transcriptional activator regulatory domain-containing protein n=2 Tax=Hypocrea jecorina TaxID=51453 RepID=A0A024SBJ6_HYPJR|nr:hypothetical protein M419DRAFT_136703 [Trichoderma reesei RUT C-30]
MCLRYRRHCLYEKHSRTPLTRRHLTEVEERLEQAEALIRQLRAALPQHTILSEGSNNTPASPSEISHDGTLAHNKRQPRLTSEEAGTSSRPRQSICSELQILDGMASLTVSEQRSGYLGIASGAAFLRLLEPVGSRTAQGHAHVETDASISIITLPNLNRHIADSMIDAYFRIYHVSYPIVHEPTFRAQYSEVIPRPNGRSWYILAYVMAALGVYTTATTLNNLDLDIFHHTKSLLSFDVLEVGSLTMVQALTLISNYQQKRDKPNAAYSYSGLAARMAMALGLHKDFQGWKISPLSMEIRRRVWWTLSIFDIGATITFGRPQVCPFNGVDISLPMNVHDKDLTAMSATFPPDPHEISVYTAVRTQARFHIATNPIYIRIISKPLPTARELLLLEDQCLGPWMENTPSYFSATVSVPPKHVFSHSVMQWRWRNFRMIMYRPFVIRRALLARSGRRDNSSSESLQAYERCLNDAKETILSISEFWATNDHIRLFAWYALYFLFQAALVPCICLQNDPSSPKAPDWRNQIVTSLKVMVALVPVNPSARRCHQVIASLCRAHVNSSTPLPDDASLEAASMLQPESVFGPRKVMILGCIS